MRHHCPDVKLETGERVQERIWPMVSGPSLSGQKKSGKRFLKCSKESKEVFGPGSRLFTCFADPVHVPVHLLLQLLLLLQEQEARARLHPVLLLRKLAVWETVIRASGKHTERKWGET